jgi:alpha-N-acetylglucosaminidase
MNKNAMHKFALVWICLSMVFCTAAQDFRPVYDLIARRIPTLKNKVHFQFISGIQKDTAVYSTNGEQLLIKASTTGAAAYALKDYLKKYCYSSFSHLGDHVRIPASLPQTSGTVSVAAQYTIRYALNYCTISYTMSFYGWKEWERELDWMALHGVNLLLAPVGVEAVWQATLKRLGYSQKEILDFIAGPAFSAWWLMGNLEGWGGPVTQGIIDQQVMLQKKILARMRELGIQPVMQGFYGMVPTSLKNKGYDVLDQGRWAGGFIRPAFLRTGDGFKKIAHVYYAEMKKLYGKDLPYFAGDPFHEGGNAGGMNVSDYGKQVQDEMQRHFPRSTWVLQGWQGNPSSQLLAKLDKSKVLVQELFGENTDNWRKRKGYEGTPFIWCSVTNFGEKSGMYGKLQRFANEVYKAGNSGYAAHMKGVGIMPEGLHNNPVVYDFLLDLSWHREKVEASDWLKHFVSARYGKQQEAVQQAWQVFLQTVYSSFDKQQEGPGESVFCARPSLRLKSVSTWGTRERNYDTQKFKEGVRLFVSASGEMKGSETYAIDKIDFVRQVLANEGEAVYQSMVEAFHRSDLAQFEKTSSLFLSLIRTQDSLLGGNGHFQLYDWLKQADAFGKTPYEKALALKNAKTQISYWGPVNPKTDLHDYANKEWNGLMKGFYLPRWQQFVQHCTKQLKGEASVEPDYFSFEQTWSSQPDLYKPEQLSGEEVEAIIARVLAEERDK